MKIFKWVPVSNMELKKKLLKTAASILGAHPDISNGSSTAHSGDNKENTRKSSLDNSQSANFGLMTTEDSNTCKLSSSFMC